MNSMTELDAIDRQLLDLLQVDDRVSLAELGRTVGLAPSSVNERIRKLVEKGVIAGFRAQVSAGALGYDLLAFIFVGWVDPATEAPFIAKVASEPLVLECHHVTGTWNYILKVRVRNTRMLEGLLSNVIKSVPGVQRTETLIGLSTVKDTLQIATGDPDWA
jgi:Lrp/AsnC family leucine-responsive transcriptional regulator